MKRTPVRLMLAVVLSSLLLSLPVLFVERLRAPRAGQRREITLGYVNISSQPATNVVVVSYQWSEDGEVWHDLKTITLAPTNTTASMWDIRSITLPVRAAVITSGQWVTNAL